MLSFIFIAITFLSLILFYHATGKDKRVLMVSLGWMLVVGIVAYSGYFENTLAKPPRFLFIIIGSIGLSVFFYKTINRDTLNTKFLLAVHTLRLLVELVLYQLFLQKKVPVLMTFKGWNFDILVGISAILMLFYLLVTKKRLPKAFVLVWNILGLVFLTTIVVIAILSSPLPLQQLAFNQPNIAILQFPFTYLPAYIVPIVFLSHILAMQHKQP